MTNKSVTSSLANARKVLKDQAQAQARGAGAGNDDCLGTDNGPNLLGDPPDIATLMENGDPNRLPDNDSWIGDISDYGRTFGDVVDVQEEPVRNASEELLEAEASVHELEERIRNADKALLEVDESLKQLEQRVSDPDAEPLLEDDASLQELEERIRKAELALLPPE
jgi:DNA repair exonuclease SbcCD ATPase subunit